jgi:hypothetical protein
MSNRRDVDLHLVGHDDTGRMATTAGRNLDRIKRKLEKFTADADRSLSRRGVDAAQGFISPFSVASALASWARTCLLRSVPSLLAWASAWAAYSLARSLTLCWPRQATSSWLVSR